MRIIIAGAGEVGTHLAKMLSNENHEIILIDSEEARLKPIDSSLDVLTHEGSATSVKILQEVLRKKTDLLRRVRFSGCFMRQGQPNSWSFRVVNWLCMFRNLIRMIRS